MIALSLACAAAQASAAQPGGLPPLLPELSAGGEMERYLRTLQTAGTVPLHPWSVRGFSPREAAVLAPEGEAPWRVRHAASDGGAVAAVPFAVEAGYNSGFPYGRNDGPVWAGRGATFSASGGVALRVGAVTAQIAPTAFWSENRAFALRRVDPRASEFANARTPLHIDLPQRFGDDSYGRVDPGESYVRLDAGRLAAGISTAAQGWGPADRQPLILGNDGPGLPHVFVGSSLPVNVGIGRLHGRVIWGEASQSAYSPVAEGHGTRRFVSGAVAAFTPAFAPGLEVGGTRFYHVAWPRGGVRLREFVKLLDPFSKASLPDEDGTGRRAQPDNQLLSVFARWVLPGRGLEVWGEYGREDHSWDLLDAYLQPDQQAAYVLGARKSWTGSGGRIVSARAEILNSQVSHLLEVRNQYPFHRHGGTPQGHTHRGQPLGAASAHGGGGWVVALDRYTPAGRASVEWTFSRVDQRWTYDATGAVTARGTDVIHYVGVDGVRFAGRVDLVWGVGAGVNLNRHFGGDAWTAGGRLGLRVAP